MDGISGPLYVGAGRQRHQQGAGRGHLGGDGRCHRRRDSHVPAKSALCPREVHVDHDCLPIEKCAPGQYTYNAGSISPGRTLHPSFARLAQAGSRRRSSSIPLSISNGNNNLSCPEGHLDDVGH